MKTEWVDPFLGTGATERRGEGRLSRHWWWPKAEVGNCHPGAALPFGRVSATLYSGGYPTGYGVYSASYSGQPSRLFATPMAEGVTHFQQSGTGAIDAYYNYLRVIPWNSADRGGIGQPREIEAEHAAPGYQTARFVEDGIVVELSVSPAAVAHRYTFPGGGRPRLVIDPAHGGLRVDVRRPFMTDSHAEVVADSRIAGSFTADGLMFHFAVAVIPGGAVATPWGEGGLLLEFPDDVRRVDLRVAFSLRSRARAVAEVDRAAARSFAEIRATADAIWATALSAIDTEIDDPARRTVFTTALYHSLLKPANFIGDSPFFADDRDLHFDFSTLWDQYRTQMPLLMAVAPEEAASIARSLVAIAGTFGRTPIGFTMKGEPMGFDEQARALGVLVVCEALLRELPGVDWWHAIGPMVQAMRGRYPGQAGRPFGDLSSPHRVDIADANAAIARVLHKHGRPHGYWARVAGYWRQAFHPRTARFPRGDYYEGTSWTYSFRLLHAMDERIDLYPSPEAFAADLDRFFGFSEPPDDRHFRHFEGLNNQSDMETPWAYLWAGLPDRTAEVVRQVLLHRFHEGPGGLPGNDDSGALSSWYVSAALGLFPVTGQGIVLLTAPLHRHTTMRWGPATLEIRSPDAQPARPYVSRLRWNGADLNRAWLSVDELRPGGLLEIDVSETPAAFAQGTRPPSFKDHLTG